MNPTDLLIGLILLGIAATDIVLLMLKRDTYSWRLRKVGQSFAAPSFVWGILGGHFWGPSREPIFGSYPLSIGALAILTVTLVAAHRWLLRWFDVPAWFPLLYLAPGVLAGALLWPI